VPARPASYDPAERGARASRAEVRSLGSPQGEARGDRGALHGDWEPFPDYEPVSKNMSFSTALTGSSSTMTNGLVGCGLPDRDEYDAAIFSGHLVAPRAA
jgi:hypothetical protein